MEQPRVQTTDRSGLEVRAFAEETEAGSRTTGACLAEPSQKATRYRLPPPCTTLIVTFCEATHLFALVVSSRLAGVSTQVDVHGILCSTSRSRERGKRDRAGGGLSGATQDFKQAARDSGRPCCLRAEMPAAVYVRVHTLIQRCAKPHGSRRQELRAGESNVAAAEIDSSKNLSTAGK